MEYSQARRMSNEESSEIEVTWNNSEEKKILDAKQVRLTEAISRKSAGYSPMEHETGRLW